MAFEEGVFTLDDGRIQVRFKFDYEGGSFQDALVFTQSEYGALAEGTLDTLKFERFNNWIVSLQAAESAIPEESSEPTVAPEG